MTDPPRRWVVSGEPPPVLPVSWADEDDLGDDSPAACDMLPERGAALPLVLDDRAARIIAAKPWAPTAELPFDDP